MPVPLILARETLLLTLPPDVGGREAFRRSFDFSKFPNLQEVVFEVGWMGGGIPWIPSALSTLKPVTSPCLSVIRLNFFVLSLAIHPVEAFIEDIGNDLRWVADEVTRIECEFEGAVYSNVLRDPGFEVVLNALDVRFRFCGVPGRTS